MHLPLDSHSMNNNTWERNMPNTVSAPDFKREIGCIQLCACTVQCTTTPKCFSQLLHWAHATETRQCIRPGHTHALDELRIMYSRNPLRAPSTCQTQSATPASWVLQVRISLAADRAGTSWKSFAGDQSSLPKKKKAYVRNEIIQTEAHELKAFYEVRAPCPWRLVRSIHPRYPPTSQVLFKCLITSE